MQKFQMTCSCGDVMEQEGATREEAVEKFKAMMTPEMVAQHFAEKHAGEVVPGIEQVHAMLEQMVQPVQA